jgi:hypothetical protein
MQNVSSASIPTVKMDFISPDLRDSTFHGSVAGVSADIFKITRFIKTCIEAGVLSVSSEPFGKMERTFKFEKKPVFTPEGAVCLQRNIPLMLKDPLLSQPLQIILADRRSESECSGLSDGEILREILGWGTCSGELMNILEILSSHDPLECTEKFIKEHMTVEKCIRYQMVFLLFDICTQLLSKLPNELELQMYAAHLFNVLPLANKRKILSEEIGLQHLSKQDLAIRISDYTQKLLSQGKKRENDFAILVRLSLENNQTGHGMLMYFNEKNKKYFWYDAEPPNDGLFSAHHFTSFVEWVSERLIRYSAVAVDASSVLFSHAKLTAYEIDRS